MRLNRTAVLVVIAVAVVQLFGRSSPSTRELQLASPYRSQNFGDALSISDWPWRVWEDKHLVVHNLNAGDSKAIAAVYDANGKKIREAVVSFEGAREVSIRGATADEKGRFFVSGTAVNDDGAVVDFIASIGENGRVAEVIREKPFNATHLCTTGDGTVWGLGQERHRTPEESYPMLRQFKMGVGQLVAVLDRQSFRKHFRTIEAPYVALRCNSTTVGVFIQSGGEWVEFDTSTGKLRHWAIPDVPQGSFITGIAFTQSGDVFASITDNNHAVPASGLFLLVKGTSDATWKGIVGSAGSFADSSRPIADVIGADNNDLVYTKDRRSLDLFWSRIQSQ
jgi:hypothetical protein